LGSEKSEFLLLLNLNNIVFFNRGKGCYSD
jgi:hypothetical protein